MKVKWNRLDELSTSTLTKGSGKDDTNNHSGIDNPGRGRRRFQPDRKVGVKPSLALSSDARSTNCLLSQPRKLSADPLKIYLQSDGLK